MLLPIRAHILHAEVLYRRRCSRARRRRQVSQVSAPASSKTPITSGFPLHPLGIAAVVPVEAATVPQEVSYRDAVHSDILGSLRTDVREQVAKHPGVQVQQPIFDQLEHGDRGDGFGQAASRTTAFSWTWLLAISEKLWPKLRIVNRTPMAVPSAPKLTAEPDQTRRPLGPLAGQDRGQRLPLQRAGALVRLEVDLLCCGHALAQHGLAAPAATTPDHQPRGRLPGTC